ncbi:MAG: bifunctional 5,10-methylenetetrahydrofolate dehydrogenase/5,10-methenyltetrahydrofolate cyclohydrolase [Parcubacteria group bacterium]
MIVEGKKIADEILAQTAELLKSRSKPLRLAMIYVSGNPESKKYLEMKRTAGKSIGIESRIYEMEADITSQNFRKKVVDIAKSSVNHAIIAELPFPEAINTQYVLNAIPEEKDPDMLSQKAQGSFFVGRSEILPPSVEAVKAIFEKYNVDPKGKNCKVFGYGILIGKPIAHWLASLGATVTILNEHTLDQKEHSIHADIIIAGANKAGIITGDMVAEGAIVIDFGYEKIDGQIVGNVVFEEVKNKASIITPVPGGVGPIGISSALKNAVRLAIKN